MPEKYAVKLSVTYSDGSIEDFDIFMASVASGLMPAGRDGDRILYTSGENLCVLCLANIAATPEVSAALVKGMMSLVSKFINAMPEEDALDFAQMFVSISNEETMIHNDFRKVNRNQG